MRPRRHLPAVVLALALVATGCNTEAGAGGSGNEEEMLENQDIGEPEGTPLIEPVSPPANEVERPGEGEFDDGVDADPDDGEQ